MSLAARIQGVGLVGPGFPSWSAGRAMLAGSEIHEALPTVMRKVVALALG